MISLMAVFSLSAKTLYLAPNDDWKSAGARFAVYAFDNGEEWYSMTAVEGETGLYQAAVDDKYPSVIFCRMNGEAAENNWGNKWNQTQDMTIEADKNLCNISGWDNAGAWAVYTPAGGGEADQYVYVKVTEEPTSWAGEYLIVCDDESVAFNSSLANNTTDYVGIGGKYSRFAVTIHNDTIDYHDTIAAKHFTIAAIADKSTYSIKSASNLYIGRTSTSNGLDKSSTNVYENAISYNATSKCVDIVGSSGAYMRYNKASNEQRFRFFKADTYTAQQPIQLYKKVKLEAAEDPGDTPEPPAKFYVTGNAALVGEALEWHPDAVKSEKDTLVLNLEADKQYMMKLTLRGEWKDGQIRGFDALTEKAEGLVRGTDENEDNIIFSLDEAGQVKVIYIPAAEEQPEVFKLIGNFHVAPQAKYYIIGNAELVGADPEGYEWTPDALPVFEDVKVLHLVAGDYIMRITTEGTWESSKGFESLSEVTPGLVEHVDEYFNHNITFTLDEEGDVTVTYIRATETEDEVFTVEGNFYVAPVEKDSIFFVNVANWGAVRVYLWGGSADATDWPGVEMTLEEEQINGHDVYKLIADKGAYANCIFSDKGNNQTGDLDWNSGKYYYVDAWYAKEDIPTVQPEDVVFTVIVPEGTDSVFIAGTFNGWAFEKMNAVEGQENKYTITKNIVKDGIEYKYTSGLSWDYVEIIEGDHNRTAWAELDEVTAWKAVPQAPFEKHDFFITGTANLVGSEELAWNPNAIPVDGNSYELHLGAGTYEMKIVLDSCGASNCQQWFGCERLSDEQAAGVECSKVGNIEFALAGEEVVTVTVDLTDTIITLTGNFYTIQMVDIRLVLSPEWAMDNAQFAAVTWRDGQEMENDGVFTDWFVGTGDTVVGRIPEDATQIAFARFAPEAVEPFMNPEDPYFWNHSDKLIIEPSMIYTITGGDVPGRNFSPGYWGERPEFIADGYFLLGNFNEWTPSAAYEFSTPDNDGQRKVTVALEENDQLKVAEYYRGYRIAWFPEGNDNNYVVDEKHAGSAQDIYFRADYGGADDWHAHCIYVVENDPTAIDNTAIDAKAEKMLRNGMILIIKGDKTYNVMGQIVK